MANKVHLALNDAATDITIEGDALELSNVDLNIQTGADFINSTTINADTLNIIAGDDFSNAGNNRCGNCDN